MRSSSFPPSHTSYTPSRLLRYHSQLLTLPGGSALLLPVCRMKAGEWFRRDRGLGMTWWGTGCGVGSTHRGGGWAQGSQSGGTCWHGWHFLRALHLQSAGLWGGTGGSWADRRTTCRSLPPLLRSTVFTLSRCISERQSDSCVHHLTGPYLGRCWTKLLQSHVELVPGASFGS